MAGGPDSIELETAAAVTVPPPEASLPLAGDDDSWRE